MCTQTSALSEKKKKLNTSILYLIAITLGIISGLSDFAILHSIGTVISDIFIKIFKCISLPIIALSIIVTLSHQDVEKGMKKIGQKALVYTISTTLIAASIALLLYVLIAPTNVTATGVNAISPAAGTSEVKYLNHLMQLIPANILAPFLEHQVLSGLLVSMVVGIAIRYIPDSGVQSTITQFFKGAHAIFLVVTGWIVKIIPMALYGFIVATIIQVKSGVNMSGLGGYFSVILLANLIQGLIILPAFLFMNKIKPFKAMRAMSPALSV